MSTKTSKTSKAKSNSPKGKGKLKAVKTPALAKKQAKKARYDPALVQKLYSDMLLIRRFEERCAQLYGMGLIGGFCHLYIGQEAVVTGVQSALQEGDMVITGYRDHGHMLVCGMDPKGVMAELAGRSGGYSKGKGGSMHMFSREKGFYGGHGIVGAQISLGAGLAFSCRYRKQNNISVTYFGDGAANQGQLYESFNMAALWRLPCLFILENNQYAMGTSTQRASKTPQLWTRGAAFGIPGEQVDGMDVLAVQKIASQAVQYCRSGNGPYIIEMKTYRYRGHSMSDPAKYRSREEVDEMRKKRDPIERLKAMIVENKICGEEELKQIDAKTRARISDAAEYARNSPEPSCEELWNDITIA